jgi:hypothetical protein
MQVRSFTPLYQYSCSNQVLQTEQAGKHRTRLPPTHRRLLSNARQRCDATKAACGRCQSSRTQTCAYEKDSSKKRSFQRDADKTLRPISRTRKTWSTPTIGTRGEDSSLLAMFAQIPEVSSVPYDAPLSWRIPPPMDCWEIKDPSPFAVSHVSLDDLNMRS